MVSGGTKIIEEIKVYNCGYCTNKMSNILKNSNNEINEFPANVFLIKHKEYGYVLFDAGYSRKVYENGLISKLYNFLNPTFCNEDDEIENKLKKDGISISDIKYIVLSHAHPDHIGGISAFSDYELITSEEVLKTIEKPRLKELVFKNLRPTNYSKINVLSNIQKSLLSEYFTEIYDVFNDNSILAVKLSGHAKGQIGLFIKEYNCFIVADASWNSHMLKNTENMTFLSKMIQNDMKEYIKTTQSIKRMSEDHTEIKVLYSHEYLAEGVIEND